MISPPFSPHSIAVLRILLDMDIEAIHNHFMKILALLQKNLFWALLLALVCFLCTAGEAPVAQAMTPSMAMMGAHSLKPGNAMPSSCPMKGGLPCCHGKNSVALCQASLCDFCVPSVSVEENTPSLSRIWPPVLPIVADSSPNEPIFKMKTKPSHPLFPDRFSFFPPVNRPLLI